MKKLMIPLRLGYLKLNNHDKLMVDPTNITRMYYKVFQIVFNQKAIHPYET
jgi:hypothetical protein